MKPLIESFSIHVERNYGDQKSRIQIGGDLSAGVAAMSDDAGKGKVLLLELRRLQGVLDTREQDQARRDGAK